MMGFEFRLFPPRPDFAATMTEDERAVMTQHVAYWSALMAEGKVLAFGPVADPHGVGIILANTLREAEAMHEGDPALAGIPGTRTVVAPMPQLVTPTRVYSA